jgi:hypothetical protein
MPAFDRENSMIPKASSMKKQKPFLSNRKFAFSYKPADTWYYFDSILNRKLNEALP